MTRHLPGGSWCDCLLVGGHNVLLFDVITTCLPAHAFVSLLPRAIDVWRCRLRTGGAGAGS